MSVANCYVGPDLGPKVQIVCKDYQQTAKVAPSRERVNPLLT